MGIKDKFKEVLPTHEALVGGNKWGSGVNTKEGRE